MRNIMGRVVAENHPLVSLVQPQNFVGWVFGIDYDSAQVMTNDAWKANVLGIPHNCFLIAAAFDPTPESLAQIRLADQEVILLRVVESARLPQDDDLVRTRVEHYQESETPAGTDDEAMDDITQSQMQFSGLRCRVLGTFYMDGTALRLGSDLESFATASRLKVYRPRREALKAIVNYVDPIRRADSVRDMRRLGIANDVLPITLGTIRYTSSARLHRRDPDELVPVGIQPMDFLARRTAVLGMTRTGKSNMVKQTVAVVKRVAMTGGIQIGQIIFDLNGEYANANTQDGSDEAASSLASIYPGDTVRYRLLPAPGFEELRNNFYEQINEGFDIIRRELTAAGRSSGGYLGTFLGLSFDQPDDPNSGEFHRWQVRLAAYKALLFRAGFAPPANHRISFTANQTIRAAVNAEAGEDLGNPAQGFTVAQASEWFQSAARANAQNTLMSTNNKAWVDDSLRVLLDMLVQRQNSAYINGWRELVTVEPYHSPRRTAEVSREIYGHLRRGRIVILDISVGEPTLREKISKSIAKQIFASNMEEFVQGRIPPNILVYIEEAHNLIGKDLDLTETWPRLAKEGAKYRIGLVYATQEVSSVHPNILSNTENWFVTHLNNEREIRELAKFYDFDDFSRSLLRAQDVGFARVKTLSSPFVMPVQIDRFDPNAERQRVTAASATSHTADTNTHSTNQAPNGK